ncbi:hypothetical protein AB3N58_17695 (plasmid) [Leptospira sp. WS60.C2]
MNLSSNFSTKDELDNIFEDFMESKEGKGWVVPNEIGKLDGLNSLVLDRCNVMNIEALRELRNLEKLAMPQDPI